MKKIILFPFYFAIARLVRFLSIIFDKKGLVKAVFIACYRDEEDVLKFGYWNIEDTPDVLSWIRFEWEGIKGRLFMIGSITEQLAGDMATQESKEQGRQQFIKAVKKSIELGAEVVLLAAGGTKRLFTSKRLEELFPEITFIETKQVITKIPKVTFGIGDNLTGLLFQARIFEGFKQSKLNFKNCRVLVIAPYGFLGKMALQYLQRIGCEVIGIGNPKPEKRAFFEAFGRKKGFKAAHSFKEVGYVDMVVACNSADYAQLIPERVEMIRRPGYKLIVIDPCEPQAMPFEAWSKCQNKVIRYDAGNGFSPHLKYVLGRISYKLLRLDKNVTWGCFCETFILVKHPWLREKDWFEISIQNMDIMSQFFGKGEGQFSLPRSSCFNRLITDFSITEKQISKKKAAWAYFQKFKIVEGLRILLL